MVYRENGLMVVWYGMVGRMVSEGGWSREEVSLKGEKFNRGDDLVTRVHILENTLRPLSLAGEI